MWSILNGTIVNAAAVAIGCAVGGVLAGRLPDRYQRAILDVLGLITITLGIDAAVLGFRDMVGHAAPPADLSQTYGARLALIMVACLVLGTLLGTALRLHDRIEGLGAWAHKRFGAKGADGAGAANPNANRFAEGFLTASVIFCVGPLTLLGCLRNGAHGDPSYLYIKSLLDAFCSIALTASLGAGVALSILTVLIFQGSLTIVAYYAAGALSTLGIDMMNVVGGVILLATALIILEIRRLPVADMLPAIFLAPPAIVLVRLLFPSLL